MKSTILVAQFHKECKGCEVTIVKTAKTLHTESKALPVPFEYRKKVSGDNEQFIVGDNNVIPDSKRSTLDMGWAEAREEKPAGGTMNSCEHIPRESIKRWKRTIASLGLVGAMLVTSACSVGSNDGSSTPAPSSPVTQAQAVTPTPSPTTSGTTQATATATATATETADPAEEALRSAGFKVGKEKSNKNGKYKQIDITGGNPMLRKAWSGPKPAGWSKAELKKGQEVAASFLARNVVDSPFAGDSSYLSKFKKEITPEIAKEGIQAGFFNSLKDAGRGMFPRDNYYEYHSGGPKGYRYAHDGGIRIVNPKFAIVHAKAYQKYAEYRFTANYSLRAIDKAGKKYLEEHSIDYNVTAANENGTPKVGGMYVNSSLWAKPVVVK